MKRILLQLLFLTSTLGFAQVGVNTTTPDPSSMLDISATNKGVLVPRVSLPNVTTTQLDGTNTAATGLLIWNTNAATTGGNGVGFYFFNGAIWIPLTQVVTGNTLDQSYDQGGAGVGKNINATDGSVRVNGDDGFLVTGTFGTGNTIDTEITGTGTRMFFNPRKAAFRAGQADGTEWNNANIGNYSIALGRSNTALNDYDVAIGIGSTASGSYSTALGWANTASGAYSFSMGQNSVASGWSSTVLGRLSTATADNSMVFGNYSSATGQNSFAFGNEVIASGLNSLAFGNNLTSKSGYESVFGIYNTDYTPVSAGGFNNADRLFVIGNGTNATNLSNALTIYKDGRMNINDAYTMPTTDGTNGQVMQTNGAGIVSWTTPTSGSDDQQIDVLSLTGDTLNISLQDDGMATQTLNLSAIDNQATDVFSLTGTTLNLSLQNDGVPTQTVNLASLVGTDDQNLITPTLVGTTLNLNIENGTGTSINLASLDTDDQNIDVLTLTGDTLNISLANDGVPTQTLNLAAIDNQATDVFSLTGTTLNLSLQNDGLPTQTVNLASLVGTDDQNLVTPTLVGTTLNLNIENGTGTSINLASLDTDDQNIDVLTLTGDTLNISLANDGVPTQTLNLAAIDNQATDVFSLTGTTLNLSLQNDGVPTQTVNLASLVGTDDQNLVTPTLVGTTLNLNIENGTGTSINLASLDTDNQQIDAFSLTGTTLNLSLQDDGVATQTVDLSSLRDHDWYEVGGTTPPNSITDNKYTQGTVTIGNNIAATGMVDINNSTRNTTLNVTNTSTLIPTGIDVQLNSTSPTKTGINIDLNGINTSSISSFMNNRDECQTTGNLVGIYQSFEGSNTVNFNSIIGVRNWFLTTSGYQGFITGTSNEIYNNLNGIHYGNFNRLEGTGTGNKYGTYNLIETTAGGTHYGLFSEVLKSGSYAGYFLGNVSIGTSTLNNYILPPSRGTNGQIMQTNAAGNVTWVNPPTDTDDQNIDVLTLTGDTLNISLANDGVPTQTLNLAAIDNQTIDTFSLVGTTLRLSLENDGLPIQTVNLASLVGTDDQNLVTPTLVGTTLNLNIENGTGTSIDLAPLQDGTGTDDQNIQNLAFNSTSNVLTVGIENGTSQTVNLSSLSNDWKLIGNAGTNPTTNFIGTTDNQDLSFRTNNTEKVRITAKGQIETTQAQSVWIGNQAGENITTGTRNTFVGHISGFSSTIGNDNTAFGGLSLYSNTTGFDNTAIGLAALFNLNSGSGNTAVGEQVAENMTSGDYNTFMGHLAAENYTTGTRNTVIGYQAGQNAAGDGNVFIGSSAGRTETGSNKLYIENSGVDQDNALLYGEFDNNILRTYGEFQVRQNSSSTLSHIQLREDTANDGARIKFTNAGEIINSWTLFGRADDVIADSRFNIFHTTTGNIMQVTGDGLVGIMRTPTTNQLEINGTASKSTAGGFLANSDSRLKKNIITIDPQDALKKVLNLRGVTYEWDDNKTGMNRPEGQQLGFVAQEIQTVFPEKVSTDNQGYLQTSYGDYDPIIFQAFKALNDKIENLENENKDLKSELEKYKQLEERIKALEQK